MLKEQAELSKKDKNVLQRSLEDISHQIKTPLTSMIGYLSLLSEIKDMPQEQRNRYIDIALDKSYRLEYLINELFDVARFNSEKIVLEKEEINLNLMLEQIADDFYPTLKEMNKKINFTSDEKTEFLIEVENNERLKEEFIEIQNLLALVDWISPEYENNKEVVQHKLYEFMRRMEQHKDK